MLMAANPACRRMGARHAQSLSDLPKGIEIPEAIICPTEA